MSETLKSIAIDAAFESAPVGLVVYKIGSLDDMGTLSQVAANEAACLATGQELKNDTGKTWAEVSPDLVSSPFADMFRGVFETGEAATWEMEYGDSRFEKNWWRGSARRMGQDVLLVAFENVTAQKVAAEEMSKRTQERDDALNELEHLFDLSLDLICIAGTDGYFRRLNPAFEKTLGWTLDELRGRPFVDFVHPHDKPGTLEQVAKLGRGEPVIEFENRYQTRSGAWRWLAWKAAPTEAGTIYAVARDVTELRLRQEELSRSNAELEQFAYVTSHDLQEPLRTIGSFTELLAKRYEGQLDDRADKYIKYVLDGVKRMQLLINDVLAYSRIGRNKQEPREVDLTKVARAAINSLSLKISESGAEVSVGELPTLEGDEVLLGSMFLNLISNALKFSDPARPPRVVIDAEKSDSGWLLKVKDNGIGIKEEHKDRIFTIFQRLHSRKEYTGTGIGLALVKKIVVEHRGRLWVESQPDVGSTFFVLFP